ncbi:MAG: trypsin-like peptidase domain-containing protein [Dehalococcoidia bacterium]|nr:trypsin-like peptidase domain-containing protein [Dehalococcoidia bacterium]
MKKGRLFFISLVLLVALSITTVSGCQLIENIQKGPAESPPVVTPTSSRPNTTPTVQIPTPAATPSPSLPSIADVVATVKPAVVAINTQVTVNFFRQSVTQKGAGSGWIISPDGVIVTNNHVIADAEAVTVVLDDGRELPVDMSNIATDVLTDLAVLRVNASNLPNVKVGDSNRLRVGDWVVAIGNSLGEGIRATQGIVSRKDAVLNDPDTGQEITGLIETDAAINPGNSGGPLVNLAGEVIGITSIKISAAGVEGTGFAISMNEALPIIQDLITKGFVTRAYLGVTSTTLTAAAAAELGLPVNKGVYLALVEAISPAGKAGLRQGDVIVKFAGQNVATAGEMVRQIYKAKIGQEVEIEFWRGSSRMTTKAVLIERQK